ncbi:putative alpha-L-arabinofuranosidase [Clohesyomyces aquaticus]|uniref:Alpha-L-arabinofuranosidase n=1 Tax=Clohesyomyces aquaticus TaxID=1231657 RepID=A0A1Y1ZTJ4_9PLEO|nr:putative alpha-L-arabinofuranosidase [Clohesyomyces aquaticus]
MHWNTGTVGVNGTATIRMGAWYLESWILSAGGLPSSFKWSSSGPLVGPKSDSRNIKGIKDPSIIYYNGKYHVFASTAVAAGYNMVYFNFSDFAQAGSASFYYLDQSGIGTGYRAAPQVFYFEPQKLWYLVYQNGNAAYSTNKDISNPAGWTAPKTFYSGTPSIITKNIGSGYWVDMWVICDTSDCHLFSSDDNGHLYRSQTTLAKFPNGMSDPVIALSESNKNDLFEASNVYTLQNSTSSSKYLLLVECIGGDGNRYFRSWTAASISGPWKTWAATESNPFMRSSNVQFSGTAWTMSISHGEMVREVVDQTMSIKTCELRYLYQGMDPKATGEYNALPWKLGLLTQVGGGC